MTTKTKFMTLTYLPTNDIDPPSDLKNDVCIPFTYDETLEPHYPDSYLITKWGYPNSTIGANSSYIYDSQDPQTPKMFLLGDLSTNLNYLPIYTFGKYDEKDIKAINLYWGKIPNLSEQHLLAQINYGPPKGSTIFKIIQTITDNPCCFSEGTKILCLTEYLMEEYRLVQNLMVGDLVKAYMNDYKPIKNIIQGIFINNPKNRSNCMYIMNKTEGNGLIEDLMVTGNHGILLDEKEVNEEEQKKNPKWANFKVDDKINCIVSVSSKFEQIQNNDVYKYYHFSLDNCDGKKRRFGVWANGILMETPP
jgi:hypothetical protein